MEEWASLEDLGFPDYEVSSEGRVRNIKLKKILKLSSNQYDIVRIGLIKRNTGKQITMSLPRLVANTFVKGKSTQFSTPINLNGDRTDNRAENLLWRPRWFAVKYFRQFDETKDPLFTARIYDVETNVEYANSREAAGENGLLEADILLSVANNAPCFPTWQRFARVTD